MEKKTMTVCLVCVLFGTSLLAQDLELTKAEKEVWELSQSLLSRVWTEADDEGALSLAHERLVCWVTPVEKPLDKTHMASWLATLEPGMFSHKASLVSVNVHGNVAIVFFQLELSEKDKNGAGPVTTTRVTYTWKKQKETWLLIGVMDAPSGPVEKPASQTSVSASEGSDEKDPTGTYTLVAVNGDKLPATVSHGDVKIEVHSGAFTINADGTCSTQTIFGLPAGDKVTRDVSATYTQEGTTLNMQWQGAGRTKGTVKNNTFTMNNEGIVFSYKRK